MSKRNPDRPSETTCVHCARIVMVKTAGPIPRYCGSACRSAASNERAQRDGRADVWRANSAHRRAQAAPVRRCPFCSTPVAGKAIACAADDCRREAVNARNRAYYRKNPESRRRSSARWRATNIEKVRAQRIRRRMQEADQYVEDVVAFEIFERDRWTCALCGKPVNRNARVPHLAAPTLDHIVPLSQGGTHERANVQCAHYSCNAAKRDRGMPQQLRLLG